MRAAFVQALCDSAKHNKKIMLITGDLGYKFLDKFASEYPRQFLNIGVSEANLVTVASGLSTTGYIPFIYSIATFASMRAFEQIRSDVVLQNANVKIVGIGAGLAYTKAGPTHHSVEDIALMRTLSPMTIINPVDQNEAYSATRALVSHTGPSYLRLERNPQTSVYKKPPSFRIGTSTILMRGNTVCLCVTGTKVDLAYAVANKLASKKITPTIVSFPTIQPLDIKQIARIARSHDLIVTIEEHKISGGFGSSVVEFLSSLRDVRHTRILRFGLSDAFIMDSGDYSFLCEKHAFTVSKLTTRIRAALR
jgi:transketolase